MDKPERADARSAQSLRKAGAERRHNNRIPAAYPVVLCNRAGDVIARGRTANTSPTGMLIITRYSSELCGADELIAHVTMPAPSVGEHPSGKRTVTHRCRIARVQCLGNLLGLGVEFLEQRQAG